MKHEKPLIICLTPIKNEAWILDRFLRCASLWADKIIIADQGSTDKSKEIASSFSKVLLVDNPSPFDEGIRQRILLDESRKIPGQKILIALDADEILSPNFFNKDIRKKIFNLNPGTLIRSKFINITPDFNNYWSSSFFLPWGFIDDGSIHTEKKIHNFRFPINENTFFYDEENIEIMHFQYTDWERMRSKHRWYQCWERLNRPENSKIILYRSYHHMYSVKKSDMHLVPDEWFEDYYKLGINLKEIKKDESYYWDNIVLEYLDEYGTEIFKLIDIWDINWVKLAKKYGFSNPESFRDPRNIFDKLVLFWLRKTQYNHYNFFVKAIDKILKKIFKI